MDHTVYRCLIDPNHEKAITNIHDCLLPDLNLCDYNYLNGSPDISVPTEALFDYNFGHHHVLFNGSSPEDVSAALLNRKKRWLKELDELAPRNPKEALHDLAQLKRGNHKKLSYEEIRYVNHVAKDPLPGCEGDRYWLFSGSTALKMPTSDNTTSLLVCGGRNLNSLYKLDLNETCSVTSDSLTRLKMSEPILEIGANGSAQNTLICVRQKHNITILQPSEEQDRFHVVGKKKSKRPNYFTSVAMKDKNLAIAKYSGSVALFDAEKSFIRFLPIPRGRFCPNKNLWSQVRWTNIGLVVVSPKRIIHLDERANISFWDLTSTWRTCENICNVFDSPRDSNHTYIATSHYLYLMDIRQQKPLLRWTHLMKAPPQFGRSVLLNDEELICLQAQNAEESVAIQYQKEPSLIPPRAVPSVPDALRMAQKRGFNPEFNHRPYYTIIGSESFMSGGILRSVVQNAGGDVFIQNIRHVNDCEDDDDDDDHHGGDDVDSCYRSWQEYEELCDALPLKRVAYDSVDDMSKMFQVLLEPTRPPKLFKNTALSEWRYRNHFTPDNLSLYKDTFARNLLSVWGVGSDPSESESDESISGETKVEDWLKKVDFEEESDTEFKMEGQE